MRFEVDVKHNRTAVGKDQLGFGVLIRRSMISVREGELRLAGDVGEEEEEQGNEKEEEDERVM